MLRRRNVDSVASGPGLGSEVVDLAGSLAASGGRAFTVGRNSGNSLPLDHAALPLLISRQHAAFESDPRTGGLILRDCGATNGTWVNEVRLPGRGTALLAPGDVVSFGGPGCIMKDGRPFRNPFVYDYCTQPVRQDYDDDRATPPAGRHDAPVSVDPDAQDSDPDSPVGVNHPRSRYERERGLVGAGEDEESERAPAAVPRPAAAAALASGTSRDWTSPGPSRLGAQHLTVRTPSDAGGNSPANRAGSPMQSVEVRCASVPTCTAAVIA